MPAHFDHATAPAGSAVRSRAPHFAGLTCARRRAVCVHEAGHAVIHALGGAYVYRLAVAPAGATTWSTTGRKGTALSDLWGVCSASDTLGQWFVRWEPEELGYSADRRQFGQVLRSFETGGGKARARRAVREVRRQLRAQVCACLAGPAAEQLFELPGNEPCLWEGEWGEPDDDIAKAEAYSWLLPWRGEFEHLAALTVATLRRPDVWAHVLAVADALEVAGDLEDEAAMRLLPLPAPDWPPGPRSKVGALLTVKSWQGGDA